MKNKIHGSNNLERNKENKQIKKVAIGMNNWLKKSITLV